MVTVCQLGQQGVVGQHRKIGHKLRTCMVNDAAATTTVSSTTAKPERTTDASRVLATG